MAARHRFEPTTKRAIWRRLDSIMRKYGRADTLRGVNGWLAYLSGLTRLVREEARVRAELRALRRHVGSR